MTTITLFILDILFISCTSYVFIIFGTLHVHTPLLVTFTWYIHTCTLKSSPSYYTIQIGHISDILKMSRSFVSYMFCTFNSLLYSLYLVLLLHHLCRCCFLHPRIVVRIEYCYGCTVRLFSAPAVHTSCLFLPSSKYWSFLAYCSMCHVNCRHPA